jgi:hypothetical protein
MCTNASPYLAKWSYVVEAGPPDVAVARTAAWSTVHNWGLGALADDVALLVAEFSSNAWTHGSLPVVVTLLLEEGVLTIEVSDAGCAGGRSLAAAAAAIAPQSGIEGGPWNTTAWARIYFQRGPAETEPGAVAA